MSSSPVPQFLLFQTHFELTFFPSLPRAMTDGLCLQGRELRVAPKLDSDPSYYAFRDALQAFQRRIDQDPAFLEGLLSAEQRQERQALVDGLDAGSPEVLGRLQRRLRQCEQHAVPRSTYNAVIRRDLARLTRGGGGGGGKQQRDDEGFNDPARYLVSRTDDEDDEEEMIRFLNLITFSSPSEWRSLCLS